MAQDLGEVLAPTGGRDSPATPHLVAKRSVALSVVLPAYNEAEALRELLPELRASLTALETSYELLVIDDGSTDGTRGFIKDITDPDVRYFRLRRNSGKSEALAAGIEKATGDVIVFMDADGQDDPAEIAKLLRALEGGLDLVSGRRLVRNDRLVKRWSSRLFNLVTAAITGVKGRDMNTGFKAMRRAVAAELELHGELHRFIPVLAAWSGFRLGEVDVVHRPRLHGVTKFGPVRFLRGFLDLLTVKFITTYTGRPLHLFGGIGLVLGLAGIAMLIWMLVLWFGGQGIGNRPALLAGILLVVVAVQMTSLGLLAELMVSFRRQSRWHAPIDEDSAES